MSRWWLTSAAAPIGSRRTSGRPATASRLTAHDAKAAVGKKGNPECRYRAIRARRPKDLVAPMLAPAHIGHLAMLRTLIRDASAEGSMTAGLAGDTPQAVEFFAKIRRALVHGYFVEEDSQSRRLESVSVPGYVFWPDDRHSGNPPVG